MVAANLASSDGGTLYLQNTETVAWVGRYSSVLARHREAEPAAQQPAQRPFAPLPAANALLEAGVPWARFPPKTRSSLAKFPSLSNPSYSLAVSPTRQRPFIFRFVVLFREPPARSRLGEFFLSVIFWSTALPLSGSARPRAWIINMLFIFFFSTLTWSLVFRKGGE